MRTGTEWGTILNNAISMKITHTTTTATTITSTMAMRIYLAGIITDLILPVRRLMKVDTISVVNTVETCMMVPIIDACLETIKPAQYFLNMGIMNRLFQNNHFEMIATDQGAIGDSSLVRVGTIILTIFTMLIAYMMITTAMVTPTWTNVDSEATSSRLSIELDQGHLVTGHLFQNHVPTSLRKRRII
jgi:hypothetical protein